MGRPSRLDVAFYLATAVLWVTLTLLPGRPWPDRLFGAIMFTCLLYLLRQGATAWLAARGERRRAANVRRLQPDEVVRAAVEEERARLSTDIARSLRESMAAIRAQVRAADDGADPVPVLLRIQAHTRQATSDLRRQLGLLREEVEVESVETSAGAAMRSPLTRRDLVIGGVVTLLAMVEVTAYLLTDGFGDGSVYSMPGSLVTSTLAATAITWRRAAPVAAASWCAVAWGLGTVLSAPVSGGLWAVTVVGSVAWTLAASAPVRPGTPLAWAAFAGMVLYTRQVDDPDNTFIFGLLIAVATVLGLVVRAGRVRGHRAATSARAHQAALEESARAAVTRERQQFAREIHDVVSHAVGVVAMQAGAAEMSWPHDGAATRRAVEVIDATAAATLAEIDRLLPGGMGDDPCLGDLVARIRATGTPVRFVQQGELAAAVAHLVYRVVQEGLTNAVRHAPGAAVSVSVTSLPDGCQVIVTDDGPGPEDRSHSGYGLVGLDERVSQAGGTVTAGPGVDGRGFRLEAHLPAPAVRTAS